MAGGGPSVGGVSTSGGNANASSGGTGGTETTEPVGTPYVFVGSTEGMVRAFVMSPTDGSLTPAGSQAADKLDFMTVDQVNKVVFVSGNDKVSAYKYDRMEETFTLIDSKASTQGTHVAVHPSGKYVFVAGYDPGEMFLHTFSEQAGFGEGQAFSPGRNAHEVRCSASGTAIYVPCLGSDHVAQYTFNPTSGVLTPNGTAVLADQSGPRHMDFHPTANVAYVLSELSSEVYVFNINLGTGALEARPADTVFTHTDARFRWSSDIRVTADGAYVYAVNRQPSEIVRFKVETTHALTRLGADALSAEVRAFGVDGAGKYLQVGAKNGTLVALRIDPQTGALTQSASRDGLGTINVTEVHYLK